MNNYNYYQNAYMGYPQANNMQGYYQRPYANQQPVVQQQVQTPVEIPVVDMKFVTSKKEVEDFIIFPNTSVLFIDKANSLSYLKIANGNAQCVIRQFSYNELSQEGKPLNAPTTPEVTSNEEFVKKSEIGDLGFITMAQYKEEYNKLVTGFNSKLKELQMTIGDIANGKSSNE